MTEDIGGDSDTPRPGPSRRTLLLGAAGLGSAAAAAGTWESSAAAAAEDRSYVSGNFALVLDKVPAGLVHKFAGGEIEGEVIEFRSGSDPVARKHIGNVKYHEFALQLGLSMGQPVRQWIESSLSMNFLRKSGELQAADFRGKVERVRQFENALISEIRFPACDGSSKDPGHLTLNFQPELTRNKAGSGKVAGTSDKTQWLSANFRFTVDGLGRACSRVSKIEALTVKQKNVEFAEGGQATRRWIPDKLELPNLKFTLPDSAAQPFYDWHEQTLAGQAGAQTKRSGRLDYLAPDLKTVLVSLSFAGVGIFKAASEAAENNSDAVRRVTFECYLENLVAKFSP